MGKISGNSIKKRANNSKAKPEFMIPLHTSKEHVLSNKILDNFSGPETNFDSERTIKAKILKYSKYKLKNIGAYLTLSAKTPNVTGKGFINAIQCHSVFSDSPNISFHSYPDTGDGPGKLEIWLDGLTTHQKLTVEIRLSGYSYNNTGSYEVKSSLASGLYGYFPVNSTSKIDLYFSDVQEISGKGLITVSPVNMTGTWIFHDVKINVID